MEGIINLHHDLMFFISFILFFVIVILFETLYSYHFLGSLNKQRYAVNILGKKIYGCKDFIVHGTLIEII